MAPSVLAAGLFAVAVSWSCAGAAAAPVAPGSTGDACGGYPDPSSSAYVLPYAPGSTYRVSQGNCSAPGNGHRGSEQYSYDFDMAIGTPFVAVRAGIVEHVVVEHADGQVAASGLDNYVVVRHGDGTRALYGHLTHDGAVVREGDAVAQGGALGASGNTGNTNNVPHLHVSVHACDPVVNGSAACPTQATTFRNARPNPGRLIAGASYSALPYDD